MYKKVNKNNRILIKLVPDKLRRKIHAVETLRKIIVHREMKGELIEGWQVDGERSIAQEWEFSRERNTSSINRKIHLSSCASVMVVELENFFLRSMIWAALRARGAPKKEDSRKILWSKRRNGGCVRVNFVLWSGQYRANIETVANSFSKFDILRIFR